MLEVEIAVCEVHAQMGTIPLDALDQIKARAKFSVERINEIEKTTNHDVIAFTTNLAENLVKRRALSLRSDSSELLTLPTHSYCEAPATSCLRKSRRCSKFSRVAPLSLSTLRKSAARMAFTLNQPPLA